MPILNVQFAGEGKRPDGTTFLVPSSAVLMQRGPVVQVTISVGQQIASQVLQTGGTLPSPVSGLALIDTGAHMTCVDEAAAQKLQLPAIDVVKVRPAESKPRATASNLLGYEAISGVSTKRSRQRVSSFESATMAAIRKRTISRLGSSASRSELSRLR